MAPSAIVQMTSSGLKPFGVALDFVDVENAMGGGVLFDNVGGDLNLERVSFVNVNDFMSLIATGASQVSGPGTTFLREVDVSSSSVMVSAFILVTTVVQTGYYC